MKTLKNMLLVFSLVLCFSSYAIAAESISVKGYSLTWMDGAGMLEVKGKKVTFNVKENGEIEKVKTVKKLISHAKSVWGSYATVSTTSRMLAIIYRPEEPSGPGKKESTTIGPFSVTWHENVDLFELTSDKLRLRIYACGQVEKMDWVEINPNED